MKRKPSTSKRRRAEITDYDHAGHLGHGRHDEAADAEGGRARAATRPPTQVVSIRLPSAPLNQLKAYASARDVPYQALVKLLLAESLQRRRAA